MAKLKPSDLLPRFDHLPAGVNVVKDSPAFAGVLLECSHAEEHRVERVLASLHMPEGVLAIMCSVCKADERMTAGWSRPVKFVAVVPEGALQSSLF